MEWNDIHTEMTQLRAIQFAIIQNHSEPIHSHPSDQKLHPIHSNLLKCIQSSRCRGDAHGRGQRIARQRMNVAGGVRHAGAARRGRSAMPSTTPLQCTVHPRPSPGVPPVQGPGGKAAPFRGLAGRRPPPPSVGGVDRGSHWTVTAANGAGNH